MRGVGRVSYECYLLGTVLIHLCSYLCCRTLPSRLSTGNGSTRTSVGSAASSRTTSSSCGSTLRDTAIVDSRGLLALLLWTASCGIVLGCMYILTGLFHPYRNLKQNRMCVFWNKVRAQKVDKKAYFDQTLESMRRFSE